MIEISERLLQLGRIVPIHPGTKRPWVRSVIASASSDPAVISKWAKTRPGCAWGLRIESNDLIVLDLEGTGKGNGRRTLDWIECDHGLRLPDGPVSTTPSGGRHMYFRLPQAYIGKIRNWTRALPGIDVRVRGGLVVIPPSPGRMWLESFDDLALEELPEWFLHELLDGRDSGPDGASGQFYPKKGMNIDSSLHQPPGPVNTSVRTLTNTDASVPKQSGSRTDADYIGTNADACGHKPVKRKRIPVAIQNINRSTWCKLFRSRGFAAVWNRRADFRDQSNSAYEFSLCIRGYRAGLTTAQVVGLVSAWWAHHSLTSDITRLAQRIAPAAWEQVREYVEQYRAAQEATKKAKTRDRILAILSGRTMTPAEIAKALNITRNTAKLACRRMTAAGQLSHTGQSYTNPITSNSEPVYIPRLTPPPPAPEQPEQEAA